MPRIGQIDDWSIRCSPMLFRGHGVQDPGEVLRDVGVDSGVARPGAAPAAAHDADEDAALPALVLEPQRAAGVALARILAAGAAPHARAHVAPAHPRVHQRALPPRDDAQAHVLQNPGAVFSSRNHREQGVPIVLKSS